MKFGKRIVIDVGAANVVVGVSGRGAVLREPAAIMLQAQTKRILAVGTEAWNALERTPENIVALRPLFRGIGGCDPDVLAGMLRYQLTNVCRQNFFLCQPGVLFAVPSCTTAYERQMLADASYIGSLPGLKAGCVKRRVALVDETLAHAVGMGLWRRKGYSAALVVGARCCQAAVFADGELALSRCVHGGEQLKNVRAEELHAPVQAVARGVAH